MEENNLHFDADLGGNQNLPKSCSISNFLKDRLEELMMLTEHIKESPFRGQTFQRLPKHMRRRQMSHHIKRLPRRLQRPYLLTLKEGLSIPGKCPSRKFRRRPSNLLAEYNRRQKSNIWLETHIWHSKRFHMIKKWEYSLPEAPTNKSFKACYRAASKHCLITDISYYNCIELKGPIEILLRGLGKCTSIECGLTFGAKMYLYGTKEGSVTFYHPDSYPYNVIGNVIFLWKVSDACDSEKTLWLWVQPFTHNEMIECLKNLFELKKIDFVGNEEQNFCNVDNIKSEVKPLVKNKKYLDKNIKFKNNIEQIKLEPKNIPFNRTPKYVNDTKSVTMTLLKDTLNRFRLTGPLSQAIVSQAFKVIEVNSNEKPDTPPKIENVKVEVVKVMENKRKASDLFDTKESKKIKTAKLDKKLSDNLDNQPKWWAEYYKNENFKHNWRHQKDFYENLSKCSSPTDIFSGLVLSVVIEDPRFTMPSKKEKAVSKINGPFQIQEDLQKTNLASSPIWNPDVRDKVSLTKLSTQEINEARSKKIVPSCDVDGVIPINNRSRIPILLIQRPGVRNPKIGRLGFGSGWDIISPAGYGMPIWHALVLRGARPGGLRETEFLNLESNNWKNYIQPDSYAGEIENKNKSEELRSRYFSLPPNKRPNYIKLGVPEPFSCAWNILVFDWIRIFQPTELNFEEAKNQKFKVLRCRKYLQELKDMIVNFKQEKSSMFKDAIEKFGRDCLIPVLIECSGKGRLKDLSMICLPTAKDFENQNPPCLIEELREDKNKTTRKELKLAHLKLLKSLKRKRRKTKSKLMENLDDNLPSKVTLNEILKKKSFVSDESKNEYKAKMESLWIPSIDKIVSFVNFSSRKIMGFIVKGDFTFSKSISTGLGYVSIIALYEWVFNLVPFRKPKFNVLIRNRDQRQYRFAKLTILQD